MNKQPSTTIHIPKYISTSCQLHLWLQVGMFLGLIIWYLDRGKKGICLQELSEFQNLYSKILNNLSALAGTYRRSNRHTYVDREG